MNFIDLLKKRRSIYALGKNTSILPGQLAEVIKQAIRHCPSAFNSQSTRAVILFGKEHEAVWNIVKNTLRELTPAEAFAKTEAKINNAFASGLGTVLFYEDLNAVKELQQQYPTYADKFPIWAEHANAIAQHSVWLTLTDLGLGANLQHYNPIIDKAIAERWDIPENWRLSAQLPFGSIESPAAEKAFMDDAQRFVVLGL